MIPLFFLFLPGLFSSLDFLAMVILSSSDTIPLKFSILISTCVSMCSVFFECVVFRLWLFCGSFWLECFVFQYLMCRLLYQGLLSLILNLFLGVLLIFQGQKTNVFLTSFNVSKSLVCCMKSRAFIPDFCLSFSIDSFSWVAPKITVKCKFVVLPYPFSVLTSPFCVIT